MADEQIQPRVAGDQNAPRKVQSTAEARAPQSDSGTASRSPTPVASPVEPQADRITQETNRLKRYVDKLTSIAEQLKGDSAAQSGVHRELAAASDKLGDSAETLKGLVSELKQLAAQDAAANARAEEAASQLASGLIALQEVAGELKKGMRSQEATRFLRRLLDLLKGIERDRLPTPRDIQQELDEMLLTSGLEPISPALGETFDPMLHQAIRTELARDRCRDNTISECLVRGWRWADTRHPLKFAEVAVFVFGSAEGGPP